MSDKKILISHRGNINGTNPERENHPDYIDDALKEDYDVEIDIWYKNGSWYTGHDLPTHNINFSYLLNTRFWLHCKNYDAMKQLILLAPNEANFFYHSTDPYTLTSKGYIWAYPNFSGSHKTIAVLPELYHTDITSFDGICSDFVQFYREIL
jgi:hypothetical protein